MANKAANINSSPYPANVLSWTAYPNLKCLLNLPVGVAMLNGARPIWVTAVRVYAAGASGSTNLRAKIGGSFSNTISIPGGNGGNLTPNMSITAQFGGGGQTTLSLDQYDDLYFGYNGSSGNTISSDGGVEKGSSTLTGAIEYVTACTAARNLQVTSATASAVSLAWTIPADTGGNYGAADIRYRVVYWSDSNPTNIVVVVGATTSTTISGLTPGETYHFVVQAMNNVTDFFSSTAANSNQVSASLGSAPSAPTVPAATLSRGSALVTWVAPASGGSPISGYEVYVGTSSAPSGSGTPTGTARSLSVTDLAPGSTNYFAVRAINSIGTSAWSPVKAVTVPVRTTLDMVGEASVQVSGGYTLSLRSNNTNAIPTITLGYMPIGSSVFTAIATLPMGAGSTQFAPTIAPNALALVADPSGNVYVIGRAGNVDNGLLVKRYVRNASASWAASGTLAGALAASSDAIAGVAAAWVPGVGGSPRPTIMALMRRAGAAFGIAYAVIDPVRVAASSGALTISQGNDPTWLSTPPGAATVAQANRGAIDIAPMTPGGYRLVLFANDYGVIDVVNGVISLAARAPAGAFVDTGKGRVLGVSSSTFVVLDSADGNINFRFISSGGSILANARAALAANTYGGAALDAWDAFYDGVNNLVRIYYRPSTSDRTLNVINLSPVTYTTASAITLTAALGAAGSDNGAMRVPGPPNDERSIVIEAANISGAVYSVTAYVDKAGNIAPTAPSTTNEIGFDATSPRTLYWAFGDPNPADTQTAYQVQVMRVSDSVNVIDTGKVVSANDSYLMAPSTLVNGVNYQWRVRTYDILDAAGTWSAYDAFTTSALGTLTITDPSADDPAGLIVDSYTVVWTYAQADGYVQTKRRVRLLDATTGDVLSDTTMQSSTETSRLVENLPSDVRVGLEVSVVTNAPGTPTVAVTRYLTTSYATPMTPIVSLDASGDAWIDISVSNPDPDGSRPQIDHNEIWRSAAGLGQFARIGSAGYNSSFRDYSVASGATYDYYAVGVASLGSAASDTFTITAPLLVGAWILDPTDPANTIRQYLYAGSRSLSSELASAQFHFVGRALPVREFGEFVDNALALTITLPFDDDYAAALARLRALATSASVYLYRDNRGRRMFVTLDGALGESDAVGSSVFSMTLTESDYDETI